ncbi:hypothetical protein O3M35_012258 [Rhynocoris fuscipes]|uniref:Helitron helicase-like domain-containing protein n=1 Tax=Rhynocoris fuscipes TaxID=488301 RepID=A0AAW1CT01_9HEMI
MSLNSFVCVSSGTYSQASEIFDPYSRNKQCVANSVCAIAFSNLGSDRGFLTSENINKILLEGDLFYRQCRKFAREDFLSIEEILSDLEFSTGEIFSIEKFLITDDEEGVLAKIAPKVGETDIAISVVEKRLNKALLMPDPWLPPLSPSDGFIFISHNLAISFWEYKGNFFVFDPHSVCEDKTFCPHTGVARFFSCKNITDLATLLLQGHPRDNADFEISRIKIGVIKNRNAHNGGNNSSPFTSPLHKKFKGTDDDSVVLNMFDGLTVSPSLFTRSPDKKSTSVKKPVKRVGRPKKRGAKKTSEKTVEVIREEARKRYREKNPDRIIESRVSYKLSYPEKVRESSLSYKKSHPEKIKESRASYRELHPDIVAESKKLYKISKPANISFSHKKYETHRLLDTSLRPFTCIGDKSGVNLDNVNVYILKSPSSLCNVNTHRCSKCNSPFFEEERGKSAAWCCGTNGVYYSRKLPDLGADFYSQEQFLQNARAFNNLFAFSAIGVSHGFQDAPGRSGISFVKIQGRVYHRVFDLDYMGSTNNTMLYIEDNRERERLATDRKLDEKIFQDIQNYLHLVNPLIKSIRQLNREVDETAHLVFENTSRRTHGPILGDIPEADEIAAVIKFGINFEPRNVVIWKKGQNKPRTIHVLTETSQEYFVDMWCRVEEERSQYIRFNQNSVLRIGSRRELDETIEGEGGVTAGRVYLPSSFTHGPLAEHDEIESYVNMRYISCSEAIWRLLEFDVRRCKPTAISLPVHMPREDMIVFHPGREQEALEKSVSKLILYFERPKIPELTNLKYQQFYENYFVGTKPTKNAKVFRHKREKYYIFERQKNECVCGLYWVSPSLGEVFFLRMLLAQFPAFSYEELRTVDGKLFGSFQEAARYGIR